MPSEQFNMQDLIKHTQEVRSQLRSANTDLAGTEIVGTADSGRVTVSMTASGEFRAVHIDPQAIDPNDPKHLEGLVLAALQDATVKVRDLAVEMMRPITDGLARFTVSED